MLQGYVLHSLAWRETSLIVEVFTRDAGRIGLVARGARRPRSALRGLLQPFQPLALRYSTKGELRTLMAAEWVGGLAALEGDALLAGFYLNELLMRLMPREDPHPGLYDAYVHALEGIGISSTVVKDLGPWLRWFECRLLREMGVAPDFSMAAGYPVELSRQYTLVYGEAITTAVDTGIATSAGLVVSGEALQALSRYDSVSRDPILGSEDAQVANEAKRILRGLIQHQLGTSGLQSRQTIQDLVRLRQRAHESSIDNYSDERGVDD
jgi:DNA repair protein RecO (recombination protein O)